MVRRSGLVWKSTRSKLYKEWLLTKKKVRL